MTTGKDDGGRSVLGKADLFLRRATDLTMLLAGLALVLMTLHVLADVIAGLVFNSPIPGTLEIVAFYYMVAAIVFPAAYLERRNEHIAVELFYSRFPGWGRRAADVWAALLTAAFFAAFTYQSWLDALEATATREVVMGAAAIEIWPSRYILPISFALMVLVSLFNALRALLRQTEDPEQEHPLDVD